MMNRFRTLPKSVGSRLESLPAPSARLLAALSAVLAAAPASAQQAADVPTLSRSASPIIGFALMFLMLVVVVVVSFMPSKRGHQD